MIKSLFLNDKFILVLILVNAIILFIGGFPVSGYEKHILTVTDHLITSLFIVEVIVKFHECGIRTYFKSNWNRLDFLLIIFSIPALIAFVFNIQSADISYLLVFRILRVFKSFRFFKFIPDIDHLVKGVKRALKTSIFVILGFVVYIFIIGVLTYYLFQDHTKYFSNPMTSIYTTFKIFTVEGWAEIPESITMEYSTLKSFAIYLYFIFVVITGGIFGLSIVNSIFVDSMVSDNNDNLIEKVDNLDKKISELLKKHKDHET